jgi:tRNA pseudouridine55 synthase
MTLDEIREGAVVLFNKPFDWSSFDVVKKVKRLTQAKVGHAGTLDPYATGLLILCTGKFTKRISEFQDAEKEYTGTMILGATTLSFDREKEIDCVYEFSHITNQNILSGASLFTGEIMQAPPAFSAVYVEGRRSYKKARQGEIFHIEKRKVLLHKFEITAITLPEVSFRVVCGKGFYVRSLVNDFGKVLQSGAYLSALCRTRIGNYQLKDAWQVEDFQAYIQGQQSKGFASMDKMGDSNVSY